MKGSKVKPQFTGLQTQTSASSVPVTILFGRNRIAPNIIWQDDFTTHKKKQKAGKGMGGSQTTYTYSASFLMALCWGEIGGVLKTWKDQSKETSYAALGLSLFVGTTPQSPWGYLTSKHPTAALGYPGIAYFAVANYDLGQSNTLQQHSFEVEGILEGTGCNGIDADPAMMIDEYLNNPAFGAGFDSDIIDQSTFYSGPDASTTGDGAFQTYCTAMGFALSPALVSQQKASETLDRWSMLCNTALVWTGYSLKFHPYGADEVTNNGVTYIPDFPVRYELDYRDFVAGKGEDPLQFSRVDPADASNSMSLIIANRDNEYNELPVPWRDQGLVDQYGRREEDSMDAKEICDPEMAAIIVALMGQRKAYIRNSFTFKLSPKFSRLEPMDILKLTDPRLGVSYVLINDINEGDDGDLSITAEEYHAAVTGVSENSAQPVANNPLDTNVLPGPVNPPIIFEPPSSLAGPNAQIWAAVSGGDGTTYNPNWGGAFVWISTDDITYNQIGQIDTAARMGKTTATLAAFPGANPDNTDTLKVSLLMSNGELEDAQPGDAEAGVTVSYVGGELLSYENVNLTGTNAYDITTLWRHLYGSVGGSHASASNFARLDDSIFKYELPPQYIGVTLYLKFQSYNSFEGAVEDLSSCVAYTYTPTGAGYGTGTGGVPQVPASFSGSAGPGYARLTWNLNAENDNVSSYKVYRATGASQPFGSATLVATLGGQNSSYTDTTGTPGSAYTYFLVASNGAGDSGNTTGINLTPVNAAQTLWSVTATGTGASQGITLPYSNPDKKGVFVYINGVRFPTAEYTISSTTLTLTSNANGDSIEIIGITQ